MPGPRVRLFTEAGPVVGLGHLTRCVALYDAFEGHGCACDLLVPGGAPPEVAGARHVHAAEWRALPAIAGLLPGVDVAVIDSYVADQRVYEKIAAAVPVCVYLDDTARLAYPAGIVVNGNPGAPLLAWPSAMQASPLLGIAYQLLRSEFAVPGVRETRPVIERILVASGGTDAAGVLATFEDLASDRFPGTVIDAVSGSRTAEQVRASMLAADVALTAAGQTLYELAATGTPAVAVTVAGNQEPQARALADAGAIALAGRLGDAQTAPEVGRLLDQLRSQEARDAMSAAGRRLVDGGGPRRVARAALDELDHITGRSR